MSAAFCCHISAYLSFIDNTTLLMHCNALLFFVPHWYLVYLISYRSLLDAPTVAVAVKDDDDTNDSIRRRVIHYTYLCGNIVSTIVSEFILLHLLLRNSVRC
mmetsp:Transcript_41252/g.46078  ORF Transcript_41252/g.46078 Transcript_41252/m.46078 type:complete len:102 (+) Transcript_41252:176-481(+)